MKRNFPQVLSLVALIYCAYVLYQFGMIPKYGDLPEARVHVLIWTLAPPLYFFGEYLYHARKGSDAAKLAKVKTWQDLATKCWAGVLAAMLFLSKTGG